MPAQDGCRTYDAMRFHRRRRNVFVASVPEQGSDIALVVDLNGLLCRGRLVTRRAWLQDEPIYSSKDEEFPDEIRHSCDSSPVRINGGLTRGIATCSEQRRGLPCLWWAAK